MTTEQARYYRASRKARAAWEATQPQLTLEGLTAAGTTSPGTGVATRWAEGVFVSDERIGTPAAVSPSGLDDGPLTADGSRAAQCDPSSGKADGGHHRTLGGFKAGVFHEKDREPGTADGDSFDGRGTPHHTTGADGSPKGNNVRPQNGD